MNPVGLYQVAVLALATAAISVTISKAQVFASVREWIAERNAWLGELINCHYCTSHWVAIALVAIYRPVIVEQWLVVDLIVSVFAMVAIAAIVSGVIIRLTSVLQKSNSRDTRESVLERESSLSSSSRSA